MGPRDPTTKWGIPVNLHTGEPYSEQELARIEKLTKAAETLADAFHECEGTSPGQRYSTRLMAIAGTQLEIALTMAIKAVSTRE